MLLFRAHSLPSGVRVRVRLPQRGDLAGLMALHERSGIAVPAIEARRQLRGDPRERAAVCATTWIDGAEVLVGFATARPGAAPAPFLADEDRARGVGEVLGGALRERLARVA